MAYPAQDSQVLGRQLKVQKVSIPFAITGNATPASKTRVIDEPTLLFLRLQGTGQDQLTQAAGALGAGESLPGGTASATDSTGVFVGLLRIRENLQKVVSVKLVSRSSTEILACPVLGFTTGGSAPGQSIVFNVDSGVDLSAANMDAVIEAEYIVAE